MLVQRTHLVRLRFRDNDNHDSTCEVNLGSSTGYAAALTFAASWCQLVQALSSAVCIEYEFLVRWTETQSGGALPLADAFQQAVFIFETAIPDLAVVRVPGIDPALLESSGPYAGIRVDQTQPAVIGLVDALTNGLGGVQACDPFANDLVQLSEAYKEQVG